MDNGQYGQLTMNSILKNDLETISGILDDVKNYGVDFLQNLPELTTYATTQDKPQGSLPEKGIGTAEALELFRKNYQQLIVASAGPRYWGFVTGGTTPAGIAGDWLTSVFDQNTQSTNGAGDVSAIIEKETIRLLMQLFNLPQHFDGGFVTGATMSNFTGLAVARQWAGAKSGRNIAREGMPGDILVMSATPHSSVIKSLSMLGFGSNNMVYVKTLEDREAIDIQDLEVKLEQYRGRSIILNCSAGTVDTVDFDDLKSLAALKEKYGFWMHVDAAFGGFAACSPAHENLLDGWENADSITVDCHKWLNVPYESAVILVDQKHAVFQAETFQNSNAPYLGNPAENFSYLNFLPENSRRFRALPAWFSLMAYGKSGFQSVVENSIARASELGKYLNKSGLFQMVAPVRLNVVCFSLKRYPDKNHEFLRLLNSRGKVFMTPTNLLGTSSIRAAFVNFRTTEKDIELAIEEMETVYALI
jgi:glutamate/tyrosine decarboxylase-like PLP-dependent enzyme